MKHCAFRLTALSAVLALCIAGTSARAQIIASDSFSIPPYSVGALNGQAVGGTGFTGNWTQFLTDDLSVVSSGLIGRPTLGTGTQAGDFANFAGGGFNYTSGQVYISYDINNTSGTNLSSSRLDLNTSITAQSASLGAIGVQSNFNFDTAFGFGSTAVAQTSIASTGAHHLVGVLDFTNGQIAIFVDPTVASFYNPNGTNDADATAAWAPPAAYTATSYSLIDNLSDQATFDNVVFARDATSVGIGPAAVPEPGIVALLSTSTLVAGFLVRRRRRTQDAF